MSLFEAVQGARRSWAPIVRRGRRQGEPAPESTETAVSRGRLRRRLGTTLIVAGVVALAYGATVYFWHDPITDAYARWKQHGLASELDRMFAQYATPAATPGTDAPATESATRIQAAVRADALHFADDLKPGQPLGRLIVPRLGIDPVFVNGTDWGADLTRGPGRYPQTSLPGLGKLTAIAGHRTTFGAWFRHIDNLQAGDLITVKMPYGTFVYRVTGHEIVPNNDWRIIRPRPQETLVLSACHPLFSASHRWIVYATLDRVESGHGSYVMRAGMPAATS